MTMPAIPNTRIGMIVGLLETLNDNGGRMDVYKLAQTLHFELDDLMPITDAAELLGFVHIAKGDIEFTDIGRKIVDGDENAKKAVFREQLIANVALVKRIVIELEKDAEHRVGREHILEYLAFSFPPQDSERQLNTVVDWSRYAELFDYDPETDQFFIPETAETA